MFIHVNNCRSDNYMSYIITYSDVLDHLDALLVIYADLYTHQVRHTVPTDHDLYYELLLERAARAYDGLAEYPDLVQEIYEDFAEELQRHESNIARLLRARRNIESISKG